MAISARNEGFYATVTQSFQKSLMKEYILDHKQNPYETSGIFLHEGRLEALGMFHCIPGRAKKYCRKNRLVSVRAVQELFLNRLLEGEQEL